MSKQTSANISQGKHTERILITGLTGCGKSTYTMNKVKKHKRVVIYDSTLDYHETLGYKLFDDLGELSKAMKANYKQGFKFCYNPDSDDLSEDEIDEVKCVNELCRMLFRFQMSYKKGTSNTKILFVLEEASSVIPKEVNINKDAPLFRKFLKKGRHYGIDFYCIDQSVTELHKMLSKAFKEYCMFQQPSIHYSFLSATLQSKEYAKIAISQPKFNYIYKKDSEFSQGQTTK